MSATASHQTLTRRLGVWGATGLGLGSMVGTGVFVGIGVTAGVAGQMVVPAVVVAAFVALCNAMSSAQLAAAHPVSGGAYEYGYKYLNPVIGFTAGWMFLSAKSASAATAALGFGGYLLRILGIQSVIGVTLIGLVTAAAVTALVLGGLKRSHLANVVIVSATLLALALFAFAAMPEALTLRAEHLSPLLPRSGSDFRAFLQACALMFVAYTGYGRIATMGEEIREPRCNIPRAIMTVMAVTAVLYLAVAVAAVGSVGAEALGEAAEGTAAPLETVLRMLGHPALAFAVAVGAMTAMLGVLLNLVLGLSRVALAMGRRGDLPKGFAKIDSKGITPSVAVIGVGVLICGLTLLGSVRLTWSFSAFTVLVYYAITNLAALRLPKEDRLYPRFFPVTGLAACAFLAFWVEPRIWLAGLVLIGAGLGLRALFRKAR
jgi:APA family basic amino acid/polyamine antiporter